MKLARQAVVTVNGALTSTATAALVPGALAWPGLAQAVFRAHPTAVVDGLLCFAPLAVPALILASGVALRSAWDRHPEALRHNARALSGWAALAAAGGALVIGAS